MPAERARIEDSPRELRLLIITFGSLGDVVPYVALAKGLRQRGHAVTICTGTSFETLVRSHGIEYAYMNDGWSELIRSETGRGAMQDMASLWGSLRAGLKVAREVGPLQRKTLSDAWDAARAMRPDVIVFYPKFPGTVHFAEALRTQVIAAPLFPQLVPTGDFPSLGFPRFKSRLYNRSTYQIVSKLADLMSGRYIREWRAASGMPRSSGKADLLHRSTGERIPVIHAFSRHVVPVPKDWPDRTIAAGYWFLDQASSWHPPAELEAFLEAGTPPVYVGFGSMAARDPQRITRIVIDALRESQVRGILATGWGGLSQQELPATILRIESAPHDWLFARVAAVVHHGGAGTTAAGLRAGRPTIVCPFWGDQPYWGERVHDLGAGSKPIPQKRLSTSKLAEAIREVTSNPSLRRNAESIGARLRGEDGVGTAIEMIERTAASGPRCRPTGRLERARSGRRPTHRPLRP